jgi:D-tyrosyl-tRNA(Tyr) deacylase
LTVATGRFQEHMQVVLQNDGPVTLMLDSADRQRPRRE